MFNSVITKQLLSFHSFRATSMRAPQKIWLLLSLCMYVVTIRAYRHRLSYSDESEDDDEEEYNYRGSGISSYSLQIEFNQQCGATCGCLTEKNECLNMSIPTPGSTITSKPATTLTPLKRRLYRSSICYGPFPEMVDKPVPGNKCRPLEELRKMFHDTWRWALLEQVQSRIWKVECWEFAKN